MKTIIITSMYSGGFLQNENFSAEPASRYTSDLGGEIINLFKTDQDENYVYINKDGIVSEEYDDTVKAVFMVRKTNTPYLAEVVAVAIIEKNGQIVRNKRMDGGRFKNSAREIEAYLQNHQISYGGALFSDIHHGQLDGTITFKAKRILFPKSPIYLTDIRFKGKLESNYHCLTEKKLPFSAMKSYQTDVDTPQSYEMLNGLINSKELWDEGRSSKLEINKTQGNYFNFLSIIKKEDDELSFSNLFYYFLNLDRSLFCKFCKDMLNIEISQDALIEREHKNIDLYFRDQHNIVAIENKIKSGINGVDARHDFSEDGKIQSQLAKYYQEVKSESLENNENTHFFIFMPDSADIDISNYSASSHYQLVKYSTLYEFFRSNNAKIPAYQEESGYYRDFCRALYRHTKGENEHLYDRLENEFIKRVKALKKK